MSAALRGRHRSGSHAHKIFRLIGNFRENAEMTEKLTALHGALNQHLLGFLPCLRSGNSAQNRDFKEEFKRCHRIQTTCSKMRSGSAKR